MNPNFNSMPSTIFDWIEKLEFAQLNEQQQTEVLKFLSEEEYTAMHYAAIGLKDVHLSAMVSKDSGTKASLLARFDARHSGAKVIPAEQRRSLIFWQAAAVLLFLLSGWLFYRVFEVKKAGTINQVASIDTVFVDREVRTAPEVIHDTVYLYKTRQAGNRNANVSPATLHETERFDRPLTETEGIEVLPLQELERAANAIRGNSMKDDSLLKKYALFSF
jgi:hypothetical protein